ncbi:MAG: hypothetical protein IPP96_02685 [Chitinophagaceae bacterium]|nr:hypothetical protein [Chitinophagaceae bacterium]
MKKIAFIILILFTVVQILPTIQSLFGKDKAIVLDISEEKKTEKNDIKSIKEFLPFHSISMDLSIKILTQIHLAESILPSPCFEKLTPPPNFC